jgi:hypothetical protein
VKDWQDGLARDVKLDRINNIDMVAKSLLNIVLDAAITKELRPPK